jgi:hypothetical protein
LRLCGCGSSSSKVEGCQEGRGEHDDRLHFCGGFDNALKKSGKFGLLAVYILLPSHRALYIFVR